MTGLRQAAVRLIADAIALERREREADRVKALTEAFNRDIQAMAARRRSGRA